jgi:RsmE family RNA methyltransferase
LKEAEVREQLVLGLEQARDTVLPPVMFHKRFKHFAEDELPSLLKGRQGVVADPSGSLLFPVLSTPKVLIIGPEGGFIPYELDAFCRAGCSVIGLGPRILRVETAVTSFLARLA